jgi:hypothetical protein
VPVSADIRPVPPTSAKIDTRDSGDVIVKFDDGSTATWTKNQHCLLPHVSASHRLVGWTAGKITETKQNGTTLVNDQLRIADADGKVITTLTDPLMIEDWAFLEDDKSVVVKSRGFHGPATIYRATIATGKVVDSHPAHEANLPAWARPFSDADAAPANADDKSPHTPKAGSPERKSILDALRAEVSAEQKRENPDQKYAAAVFTPKHFNVLGNWAFVDTSMVPEYGENGGVLAALHLTEGQWLVKFTSYADDVTNYDQLAKKLDAPRSIFPIQGKLPE